MLMNLLIKKKKKHSYQIKYEINKCVTFLINLNLLSKLN